MAKRIRMGGPTGVTRPYVTLPQTDDPHEQIAQALDHIAISISAIDHNLEILIDVQRKIANAIAQKR